MAPYLFTFIAMSPMVDAFWGTGHLLIANMAQGILEANSTTKHSLELALRDLTYLQESHKKLTYNEGEHPFTECALFADKIKGKGFNWQSTWHFIDQPLYADDFNKFDY